VQSGRPGATERWETKEAATRLLEKLTEATRHEREHLSGHHLVLEHLLPLSLLLSLLVLLKLCLHLLLHLEGDLSLSCQRLYQ
jgi:hypothetical protein